jgi:putative DNA methylase
MTGPENARGETTWGGLAEEVRYWGNRVLEKAQAEIGDLYPLIPNPTYKGKGGTGFQPVQKDLFVTQRNLPHWQIDGSTYFVTFRTVNLELPPEARKLTLNACRHFDGQRYTLWAAVIMPDHVHLLLQPKEIEAGQWWSLSSLLHSIKSFTSKAINKLLTRKGSVWQDESFDRIVRDEKEFLEKWNYIRNNPVNKGLCKAPEEWDGFYECTGKMPVSPESMDTVNGGTGFQPVQKGEGHPGYLLPVAYLWTRSVRCKNPICRATVPLVRQTWLCKKKGRYVALKMVAQASSLSMHQQDANITGKRVRFEAVEATSEQGLGFDPAGFSKGGNATCPFCGTVADSGYVKAEGQAGRLSSHQMMAIVCTRPGRQGKIYLAVEQVSSLLKDTGKMPVPLEDEIKRRLEALCQRSGLTVPSEPIEANPRSMDTQHFGFATWADLFTPRQMLCLLTFVAAVREAYQEMVGQASGLSDTGKMPVPPRYDAERAKAVGTYLATAMNREAEDSSSLCRWNPNAEKMQGTFGRQALPMVWDFCEISPFGNSVGDWSSLIDLQINGIEGATQFAGLPAHVSRGSATTLPWPDASFDAVITDPPYYDNVDYAKLADFFYVWLRRTISHSYPEHFASEGTPKKSEIVADPVRHSGSKEKARQAYERMMAQSFAEANRVLKPGGQMVVVYAHKTTLGWATLVDALRRAGFTVTEAWPLDTEMKSRLVAMETASLASSIFLVACKREGVATGSYEDQVRPELEAIVHERVDSLWKMGVMGADLVIAAVGAGLRTFTHFARVEYANGEEVPAERFLAEVETVVLENILARLSKETGTLDRANLAGVDSVTRFYILWRYTYRTAELEAGEAIIFANGTHVELDGPGGLSTGARALVEKKKGKYHLLSYTDRGDDDNLGMPEDNGQPVPVIDALHRTLWLMENRPGALAEFLREAQPNREHMRLVAQALAGPALKGGDLADVSPTGELAALAKLTANWRSVIEDTAAISWAREERLTGQRPLFK